MYIGGFQKNSLIDFPATIACVVFTQGCNFICPYCHNPNLVTYHTKNDRLYDENKIFDFLKTRQNLLEGVVITGGEPTLQKDIIEFCKKIKNIGYKLKLDTNGTRPNVIEELINQGLIDFISMDIKTSLNNYHLVSKGKSHEKSISKSIDLLMHKSIAYEFRTTCCKPFINKEIIKEIGKRINKANCYILQKCSRKIKSLDQKFLSQDNNFFSDEYMLSLKQIIDKYVTKSIIR